MNNGRHELNFFFLFFYSGSGGEYGGNGTERGSIEEVTRTATRLVSKGTPTNISVMAPDGAANNCGHPANLSRSYAGPNPLRLAGCP